jgi:hypothetical protein
MATARELRGQNRADIVRIANYFAAHAQRMKYAEYLAKGYPIATGVIEGACRHLVIVWNGAECVGRWPKQMPSSICAPCANPDTGNNSKPYAELVNPQ